MLTALLFTLGICSCESALTDSYALLVGINDYTSLRSEESQDVSGRTWRDLKGAVNDAQAIGGLLQARYHIPAENIQMLTADSGGQCGEQGCPTRSEILTRLENHLLANAGQGDQVLFYYAGHGSQVANPESSEQDEFDESLVPMDAVAGAPDIRDKRLRQLFNQILDRGARLLVIVDSCHSGSISRGNAVAAMNSRELEPLKQVLDDLGDPGPVPATRGAIVMSAASPAQLALEKNMPDGTRRGGFSYALIKALMTGTTHEPLERTFQRTEVFMKGLGLLQTPQLDASEARAAEPLITGGVVKNFESRQNLVVGIISVQDGTVLVRGGKDLGLHPGARIVIEKANGSVELEITQNQGLTRSMAKILPGGAIKPQSGDLANVTQWAWYEPLGLRVWIDPDSPLKTHLGNTPSIALVGSVADADYVLVCRETASEIQECSWRLAGQDDESAVAGGAAGLPVSTDWVKVTLPGMSKAATELGELAFRLAKLKSWVSLASPPALLPFPYQLEFRHAVSDKPVDLTVGVDLGERYRIVLASAAENIGKAMIESKPKYVYVGGIDSYGDGYLLYPSDNPEYDHCEQLPCRTATKRDYQSEYVVFEDYLVQNRDTDLIYLITSDERIDPGILKFEGVRSSSAAENVMRSGNSNGLEAVLAQYASGRPRSGLSTPMNWSIDHYLVPVATTSATGQQ